MIKQLPLVVALLATTCTVSAKSEVDMSDIAMKQSAYVACKTLDALSPNGEVSPQTIEEAGHMMDTYYEIYVEPYSDLKGEAAQTLYVGFTSTVSFSFGYYTASKSCEKFQG